MYKYLNKPDASHLCDVMGIPVDAEIINYASGLELLYEEITPPELDELLLLIAQTLLDGNPVKAGEHRRKDWEDGWGENFALIDNLQDLKSAITPKYFDKYNVVRFDGRFIQPRSKNFEMYLLSLIVRSFSKKYFKQLPHIYEFGCGTGHNLMNIRSINKNAQLVGCDWAKSSQAIIGKINELGADANITGFNFNYFSPKLPFDLPDGTGVITVASLEQVGDNWQPFVEFLMRSKPKVCVHIEPIAELLDKNVLLDYLSIKYFEKRNYLKGFLNGLKALEARGKIEILEAQRSNVGSLFIEGYSVVAWRPI